MRKVAPSKAIVAVLLFVSFPALSQQTGRTVRHHQEAVADPLAVQLDEAERALEKNDFVGAEKLLQSAVSKDPKNYRAWYDLGYVYTATNRRLEAVEAYRKSIAANPQVFESNLNLGLLLEQMNDVEAARYLTAAIALKPASHPEQSLAQAYLSLGHVIQKDKPEEALKAYRHAAELQPQDPAPHLQAAILLQQQQNFSEAAAEFQRAMELDSGSDDAVAGFVSASSRSGQLPQAESLLRTLIAKQPTSGTLHVQLGRVLAAQNKNDEAISELSRGLELAPADAKANEELIQLLLAQKKYSEALPYLKVAVQTNDGDPNLHYLLGTTYIRNKNFPEAQDELIKAVKLKSDFGQAYNDLAFAASENKNFKLCVMALDARAKFLPETSFTYFLRATALDHLHDWPDAIINYEKFLAVDDGKLPDQEWQARHRLIAIDPKRRKK